MSMSELRQDLEEILESIWMLTEDLDEKATSFEDLYENMSEKKGFSGELTKSLMEELVHLNFIEISEEGKIQLSRKGYERARQIMRSHRLYERLFSDVLRMNEAQIEREACVLEHVIAKDVEESVCTLLGHPKTCPHGFKIPPGPCCKKRIHTISSIIVPVTELEIGEEGVISYITSESNRQMDKLLAFGILPGNVVKLHQKMPLDGPIIIQIDETQVALEKFIAEHIHVRRKMRK